MYVTIILGSINGADWSPFGIKLLPRLTHSKLCNFSCFFVVCCFFFFFFFCKNSFINTIIMSNSLDPDQARRFVGPDLGPNCLPMLPADDTSRQRVKHMFS